MGGINRRPDREAAPTRVTGRNTSEVLCTTARQQWAAAAEAAVGRVPGEAAGPALLHVFEPSGLGSCYAAGIRLLSVVFSFSYSYHFL